MPDPALRTARRCRAHAPQRFTQVHKYAAHKLALLYHAVNLSKFRRDELRKRIEERFDEVKSATEVQENDALSPGLVEWLARLCADIVAMIREVPPSVPRKLHSALQFVQGSR